MTAEAYHHIAIDVVDKDKNTTLFVLELAVIKVKDSPPGLLPWRGIKTFASLWHPDLTTCIEYSTPR